MKTLLVYSMRYIPDPRTDDTGAIIYSSGVDVSGDTRDYDLDATHISFKIDTPDGPRRFKAPTEALQTLAESLLLIDG
jgi:hypothetical protein